MTEDPNHIDPEQNQIKKLLTSLPKVTASTNFEGRLQRRINQKKTSPVSSGLLRSIFRPRRIPGFVYSLVAVAVVGLLSYYTFFRPTFAPPEITPGIGSKQENPTQRNLPIKKMAPESVEADRSTPSTISAPASAANGSPSLRRGQQLGDNSSKIKTQGERSRDVTPQQMVSEPQINTSGEDVKRAVRSTEEMRMDKAQEPRQSEPLLPMAIQKALPQMKSMQIPTMFSNEVMASDSMPKGDSLKLDSLRRTKKVNKPNK